MDMKETIYIKKYEAALKAAEDCRKREGSMINYSILIYGASIWGIFTIKDGLLPPSLKFVSMVFLSVLMGIIGLYIAKLNLVEIKHFRMEREVYDREGVDYSYANWPKPGFNKTLIWLMYLLTILFAFVCSLYISGVNFGTVIKSVACNWLFIYAAVFLMSFAWYAIYFYNTIHCLDDKNAKKE